MKKTMLTICVSGLMLGLLALPASAADVAASYSWDCWNLPTAAGWTDNGNFEAYMFLVTTDDGESAIQWYDYDNANPGAGSLLDGYKKITMDPANIPGHTPGSDFTFEVRSAGVAADQYYGRNWRVGLSPYGGVATDLGVGTGSTFPESGFTGVGHLGNFQEEGNDWVLGGDTAYANDNSPSRHTGTPTSSGDDWLITRVVYDWTGNDVNIKMLSKIGPAAWDVTLDATYTNVIRWGDGAFSVGDYWVLNANSNTATFGQTTYIDYIRWVDTAVADGDTLGAVPEPATMSLLALGGLALLRRRK